MPIATSTFTALEATSISSTHPINMLATSVATVVDDVTISNNVSISSAVGVTSPNNCPSSSSSITTSSMATAASISAGSLVATTSSIDALDANSCNNMITTSATPTICIGGGAVTSSNCDDLLTNSMLNGVAAIQQSHNVVGNSAVSLLDCNDLKSTIDQQQSPQSQAPKMGDLNLGSVTSNGGAGSNSLANILISPAGSGGGGGGYMSHSDHSGSVGLGSGNGVNGGRSNTPLWSTAGDDTSHLSMNGFGSFPNFNTPLFNGGGGGGNLSAPGISHQQQRRAITASQQNFPHHGLSPNRSAPLLQTQHQQQQQQNQQQNMFKNPYPAWSNAAAAAAAVAAQSVAAAWSAQQHQQQHPQSQQQNQQNQWSRGRSVPNLNPPLSGNSGGGGGGGGPGMMSQRKPTSPNPGPSQSPFGVSQSNMTGISPLKYRRSTSFPGKSASPAGYSLDVPTIDDGRDPFMGYQDRPGMGNGLDMRSLEHCLSDIMRNVGETNQQDHLKGNHQNIFHPHIESQRVSPQPLPLNPAIYNFCKIVCNLV